MTLKGQYALRDVDRASFGGIMPSASGGPQTPTGAPRLDTAGGLPSSRPPGCPPRCKKNPAGVHGHKQDDKLLRVL